jgi:hypothetical protein
MEATHHPEAKSGGGVKVLCASLGALTQASVGTGRKNQDTRVARIDRQFGRLVS